MDGSMQGSSKGSGAAAAQAWTTAMFRIGAGRSFDCHGIQDQGGGRAYIATTLRITAGQRGALDVLQGGGHRLPRRAAEGLDIQVAQRLVVFEASQRDRDAVSAVRPV